MHNSPVKIWLYSLPILFGVLAGLWRYSLADMDLFRVAITATLLGWLIYRYLLPVQLIKRRALLAHLTTEASPVRRIFWNSRLLKLVLAVSSGITALYVLVMLTGLHRIEWYVLFGSVLSFLALYILCTKALGSQLNAGFRFYFILRIAYRINLALMTVVLVTVQIIWLEVDDTRYLFMTEVFRNAYLEHSAAAVFKEAGWLIGLNAAVSDCLWHIMQHTTQADGPMLSRLLAWLAFLIFNAIKLGAIWAALLGIPTLIHALSVPTKDHDVHDQRSGTFDKIFAVCVILGLGAILVSTRISVEPFIKSVSTRLHQTLGFDPCQTQAPVEQKKLASQANQALSEERMQLMAHMAMEIDQRLDDVFAMAEPGVDNFLDWNFSLKGQYTQLLFLSRSMVGERSLTEHISARMDSYIDGALNPGLHRLNSQLNRAFNAGLQRVFANHETYLRTLAQQADCAMPVIPDLPLTDYVNKSLVGSGLFVGPAAGALAARAGTRAVRSAARVTAGTGSRVAARPASKRIISSMFGRLTARATAGTASGTAGAVCGPFVLACGSAFAVATWIGMDLAINEIDEALHRQQMRKDMLAVLNEQKMSLNAQLKEQYRQAAALAFGAVEDYQHQMFNIRRDALGSDLPAAGTGAEVAARLSR